jgi:hypothetical protein
VRPSQLNLTQSTVSQQIKRLERETKRPLFRCTTRAVVLTDDGEMFLGDARRVLQTGRSGSPPPYSAATFRYGSPWSSRSRFVGTKLGRCRMVSSVASHLAQNVTW